MCVCVCVCLCRCACTQKDSRCCESPAELAAEMPLFSIIYHFIDLSIKTVKPAVRQLYCFPPTFISLQFGTARAVSLSTAN